jgi:hypothetical protein
MNLRHSVNWHPGLRIKPRALYINLKFSLLLKLYGSLSINSQHFRNTNSRASMRPRISGNPSMLLKPTIKHKFRSNNKLCIITKPVTHVKFININLHIPLQVSLQILPQPRLSYPRQFIQECIIILSPNLSITLRMKLSSNSLSRL